MTFKYVVTFLLSLLLFPFLTLRGALAAIWVILFILSALAANFHYFGQWPVWGLFVWSFLSILFNDYNTEDKVYSRIPKLAAMLVALVILPSAVWVAKVWSYGELNGIFNVSPDRLAFSYAFSTFLLTLVILGICSVVIYFVVMIVVMKLSVSSDWAVLSKIFICVCWLIVAGMASFGLPSLISKGFTERLFSVAVRSDFLGKINCGQEMLFPLKDRGGRDVYYLPLDGDLNRILRVDFFDKIPSNLFFSIEGLGYLIRPSGSSEMMMDANYQILDCEAANP